MASMLACRASDYRNLSHLLGGGPSVMTCTDGADQFAAATLAIW